MPALLTQSLLQLFYPHVCAGCGNDALPHDSEICLRCLHALPRTGYEAQSDNPMEKSFTGRLPVAHAMSLYYFNKYGPLQQLIHELKYRGNKKAGTQLGMLLGNILKTNGRFADIDAIIPLPLYAARQRQRGYNQAAVIADAVAAVWQKPVITGAVIRLSKTATQTKKTRLQRWQNMQGRFALQHTTAIKDKHLLLLDDVMTTGATLESCGNALLQVPGTTLSIATVAYASRL